MLYLCNVKLKQVITIQKHLENDNNRQKQRY